MTIEELVIALGLEGEDNKEKVDVLTKEFNEKTKEYNTLSKKIKELEEAQTKSKEAEESFKSISDKFDIVTKAFSLDLEAEDFDKMLDDVKDKLMKENGGGTTPEEFKTLTRDLTKANRDLTKANTTIKELTDQLEAEKTARINSLKKSAIKKQLESVNALNPEMMVDLFFNKVSVDKDGVTLTMKDAAGNEISIADGIADWAKENKDFIKADVRGGVGSAGGLGGKADNNGVSDFMKRLIAEKSAQGGRADSGKSVADIFG